MLRGSDDAGEGIVTGAAALLVATVAVPLGMLAACVSRTARRRMPRLLALAPLPGLAAALLAGGAPLVMPALVMDQARLRFTLELDAPSALLLGVAALLWSAAGAYAAAYPGTQQRSESFAIWWLLTLSGSLGVFIAADLGTFYFAFAVVSLSAYGLVVHDRTAAARRAGAVYILLAVLGEICLLLAFALMAAAAPGDSIAIRDIVAALPGSPWRNVVIGLLVAGFGLKAGLFPLHVWLPIAHPAAPMPASAVLSGAIIKAGIIGLIRFLPYDGALADSGGAIAALGLLTAFYGVVVGVTQANPKTVLAYSSVSQMGVVAAVLGMGMQAGDPSATMAAAFYAAHHVLAKGALFLAVGAAIATGQRRLWIVLGPVLLLALGFGGLPLTGGALAKAAIKGQLGAGLVGLLASLSAAGTTLLMLHFVRRLAAKAAVDRDAIAPTGMLLPSLAMAFAAVACPWALFLPSGVGRMSDVVGAAALWAALWPVLLGAVLAFALRRWWHRLPRVPEGDILLLEERALRAGAPCGRMVERMEGAMRSWPVAGLALLALAAALGAAAMVAPDMAGWHR
jgi:formate hydrogenlyase subunit 3/multisubunit Na+/H+ antiporter MnhD subunit